jgi:hypothetical protein
LLHLECITNSYSLLYLTDSSNQPVSIPNEFVVYDNVYDDKNSILQVKKAVAENYSLSWCENYVIKYNGEVLFSLTNPRVWNLSFEETKI